MCAEVSSGQAGAKIAGSCSCPTPYFWPDTDRCSTSSSGGAENEVQGLAVRGEVGAGQHKVGQDGSVGRPWFCGRGRDLRVCRAGNSYLPGASRPRPEILLLSCFIKHRCAKSLAAPVWVHTQWQSATSRNRDPSHLVANWRRFCSQIACHLRNYTNPVFQVRAWGVSQLARHLLTLIAAAASRQHPLLPWQFQACQGSTAPQQCSQASHASGASRVRLITSKCSNDKCRRQEARHVFKR